MEAKQVKDLLEAYSSIYEKKEEPEMEEGEEKESEKDEGGKHKEGKHKKGKEEKGEKVTEKEDEDKEDEKKMKEEVELDEAGLPYGPVGRGFRPIPAGRQRKAMMKRAGALRTQAMNDGGDGGTGSPRGKMGEINDALTNPRLREETDLFDCILEHLVAEGYADTNQAALAIMANMSEEWKQSILDESRGAELRAKHGDNPSKKLETKAFGKAMSYDNRDRLPTGTGTEVRARYLGLSGRARSRARGETPASSAVSPDNESRTVRSRGGRARGIGAGENRDRPTG